MGKNSKRQRRARAGSYFKSKAKRRDEGTTNDDSEDEIDAFHKQRDMIPLDINNVGESEDEDLEEPAFDLEGAMDDDSDDSGSSDDLDTHEDDNDGADVPILPKRDQAKLKRTLKYMEQVHGGVDDMDDHEEEEDGKGDRLWGRSKNIYYNADNMDYDESQESDEDSANEEGEAVLKMQKEKAALLSEGDFGLEDGAQDESDPDKQDKTSKLIRHKTEGATEATPFESYEKIERDLGTLSKDKQMDVVFSSAPELFGLLSELNEALEQLGTERPTINKVKAGQDKGKMNHLEVKRALLLIHCQAISFYLLLKSEGQPIQDHPVIARLVEIKNMIEKMKQIDVNLPLLEDTIGHPTSTDFNIMREDEIISLNMKQGIGSNLSAADQINEATEAEEFKMNDSFIDRHENSNQKDKDIQMGLQSLEMLKVRANLEAKLKEKGLYGLMKSKPEDVLKPKSVSRTLQTLEDFEDEVQQNVRVIKPSNLLQAVATKPKKTKFVSGDDDLPKRDDIGERRRKHELRVLARVGVNSLEDDDGMADGCKHIDGNSSQSDGKDDDESSESTDEFYQDVKRRRTEKLLAKEQMYSVTPTIPSFEEDEADGKRQITYQMEKNRGLTRSRNKKVKNPRKKYRVKHKNKVTARKGQVRDIRKPSGPYGGELSGINANVSRSIRFKN